MKRARRGKHTLVISHWSHTWRQWSLWRMIRGPTFKARSSCLPGTTKNRNIWSPITNLIRSERETKGNTFYREGIEIFTVSVIWSRPTAYNDLRQYAKTNIQPITRKEKRHRGGAKIRGCSIHQKTCLEPPSSGPPIPPEHFFLLCSSHAPCDLCIHPREF